METNYKVYVHINKVNGKRYYGITKQEVEKRWGKNGKGYRFYIDKKGRKRGNEHFWNSICKYGWNEGFEHIVIARGLTEEEAKWLEIELIREHDTTNQDKGYNITKGGDDSPMDNEEVRKKISEAHKGKTSHMKGKKHTEETRKKISEAHKGKTSHMKGKKHTEETRKKISEASKKQWKNEEYRKKISEVRKGKGGIKIYCVELDMYFDTLTEAERVTDCGNSSISEVLHGKRKTAKGYHWLYAEDVNEENINRVLNQEKIILKGKDKPNATKVYCVELDMYFETITEASEFVGCSISNISQVLTGKSKTAKGYHWLYAEDVETIEIENKEVS